MIFSGLTVRRLTPSLLIRSGIAMAAVLLTLWAQWLSPAGSSFFADAWLRDRFLRLQVSSAPEPRILVVDIDEASLAELGPWPWPRSRLADLVETLLTAYSARGVGLDIVLPRPADSEGDTRLALLARHAPLVLAQAFDYSSTRPDLLREGQLAGAVPLPPGATPLAATGYIANQPAWHGAPHVGNIGYVPDSDGVLRRVPLLTTYQAQAYPALALAILQSCCNAKPDTGHGAVLRVPYQRDWSAYTVVSAADILAQRIAAHSAAGRVVLVGSSSLGLGDRVATPLAPNRPGLGVQAEMLSALLDIHAGVQPAPWPGRLLAALYALGVTVLVMSALPRLSAAAGVALLAAAALLWLGLAYLLAPHDPALVSTGPLATLAFLLAVAVPYQWQQAQRRSRHLLGTLRQYVAPSVVQQLLRQDIKDPLAPRQLDVTTLIADMEGYTSHVESLPVEQGALLTREFLACLTGPVIEQEGTLDKYTGDGLVAFWGAPLPQDQHADKALDAAAEILRRVRAFSAQREADGHAPLRVRIGIESGTAMAGDFGTSFRSIYTAVGDSVNTASRLEQAARDFPHDVIVGAGTVARARRHHFLLLGERQLRGKEKTTTLYTIAQGMDTAVSSTVTPPALAPSA
ncbi:CHASE2 domain-containing protein [Pseudoduganella sp. FT55W]|uniref:CHASE2 domain-containing protein n=1 Tax=Duganella rivi TaxID=2666083 RepID=A0A7X4GUE0_9BURK|nr:adenylate/guanylate cyclase domain-containing protein [Duganella rivi]MYM68822.1 CHASE2 domain-containing protein [Duganella rivi]